MAAERVLAVAVPPSARRTAKDSSFGASDIMDPRGVSQKKARPGDALADAYTRKP
jgi:hypothetical protein